MVKYTPRSPNGVEKANSCKLPRYSLLSTNPILPSRMSGVKQHRLAGSIRSTATYPLHINRSPVEPKIFGTYSYSRSDTTTSRIPVLQKATQRPSRVPCMERHVGKNFLHIARQGVFGGSLVANDNSIERPSLPLSHKEMRRRWKEVGSGMILCAALPTDDRRVVARP